ncbi:MAG: hypothetical protein QY325_09925 [Flavobacteriales bacterium]|nr:MAG: hypothetical protein QY325_09925 [Flavobacteriales bacterium]
MGKSWNEPFEAWARLTIPIGADSLVLDARFKFDPRQGVVLDFMAKEEFPRTLNDLLAGISGIGVVAIPEATYKARSIGLNHEYRYTAKAVLLLGEGLNSPMKGAIYACSSFPEGDSFLGHNPFNLVWTGDDEYTIRAKNIDLNVDWGIPAARLTFETGFQANWDATDHHRLSPATSFSIAHDVDADWHLRIEELNRLRAMLDFLAFKPQGWSISHLHDAGGGRMTHISQQAKTDQPSSPKATSFFALPLNEIQQDFGGLMRFGFTESWRLSSFGEIAGLIRYPSRSFEDRLFSAIRALEARDGELRPTSTDENLVTKLSTFDAEWKLLGIPDIRAFRWLLRNTRNYLAHLTASEDEPPFNENDRYRAYFQSVAACRASLLRAGGMSSDRIEKYLTRVRDKCQAYHGAMDFSRYPATPLWVKRVV